MEIKYTIEILTKDIQDIEKLVGNLRNSEDDSTIDLDLALSKIRNVYEILTMIKADRLSELIKEQEVHKQGETKREAIIPEAVAEIKPEAEPEPVAEPLPKPEASTASKPEAAEAPILAEKFSAESSINENLAGKHSKDLESRLKGQPIDNISRNIGINDRFLIIRELFQGDAEKFSELIGRLDRADNFEAARGIMEKQFSESMDHEGVAILEGLVKRRHIR